MQGKELLEEVIHATGLPEDPISEELHRLLSQAGVSPTTCSLDDLRALLTEYAQAILLEAKETYSEREKSA